MSEVSEAVCRELDRLGIGYRLVTHRPLFHIDECADAGDLLGAVVCKNYFLTTKSRKAYCLCVARPDARLRTADLSRQAGTPRLSFADEGELERLLRTKPGSVSPLGLMFDAERRVRLLLDRALLAQRELAFHPCDNTQTLALSTEDFLERFLPAVGRAPELVELPNFD